MIIKVEVDLSDFYSEEEQGSFNDEIKSYIANQVKYEIFKDFEKKALEIVSGMASKLISQNLESEVKSLVRQTVNKRKLSSGKSIPQTISESVDRLYSGQYSASIDELIKRKFTDIERTNGARLETLANNFVKELKDRHDLLFASQIVAKMNEQGLLKNGVADLLLNKG